MTHRLSVEDQVKQRFPEDTANHTMEVVHDDGLYRHLRFRQGNSYHLGFDVVTWPWHIAITGDMGSMTLSRVEDMLSFVGSREDRAAIDYRYFAQKIVANDGPTMKWSADAVREHLRDIWAEHCDEEGVPQDSDDAQQWWGEIEDEILSAGWGSAFETEVREALATYEAASQNGERPIRLSDTWEWDCQEFDYATLWRMHALRMAANTYARSLVPAEAA